MPQIWLTYDELGTFFGLSAEAARGDAIERGWSRRRCSDGLTRVKMPPGTAHLYMMTYARDAQDGARADHPVHTLQQRLTEASTDIVRRRVPRERDWSVPEAANASMSAETGEELPGDESPSWARAVRRMFG
jgi:hypothetical protein